MEKLKETLLEEIKEIKKILNEIKEINEEIKSKKDSLKRLDILYEYGWIDRNKYLEIKKDITKEISLLENKKLEKIGAIKNKIEDIKNSLKIVSPEERKHIKESVVHEYQNIIYQIPQIIPEMKETDVFKEFEKLLKEGEVEIETERIKVLEPFLKEEETKIKVKEIKRIKRKKVSYNIKKEIISIIIEVSTKIFGGISKFLLDSFPSLYYITKRAIIYAKLDLNPVQLISLNLFILTILVIIFTSLFLYFKDIFLFVYFISFLLAIGLINYILINEIRKRKKSEIDNNLVFAIIHLSAILQSGISLGHAFKIISTIEEYGELSKEFRKISDLMDAGVNITDAIEYVRKTTISERLRDFLDALLLTISSGRSIKEFLIIYSQSAIVNYRTELEKLNRTLKTLSDLYVGMVLTVPMILVSMGVMLVSLVDKVFGMDVLFLLNILIYGGVPLINIGFIMLIDRMVSK